MGTACFYPTTSHPLAKYPDEQTGKKNHSNTIEIEKNTPLQNLSFFTDDKYFGQAEITFYSKNIENKMKGPHNKSQEKNIQ